MPNRYGEYLTLIFFIYFLNLFVNIVFYWNSFFILRPSFMMSLVYIYCKKNPEQRFKVFFLFLVKGAYFPWIHLVIELMMNVRLAQLIIGLVVGHAYIYLKYILPISRQRIDLLRTPKFM